MSDDGFNTTVTLDCGCEARLNLPADNDWGWKVGAYDWCSDHSEIYGYDESTGEPKYERDRRVVAVVRDEDLL